MRPPYVVILILMGIIFAAGLSLIVAGRYAINAQCPRGLIEDRTQWPKYLLDTIGPLEREGLLPQQMDGFRLHVWSDDYFAVRFLKADVSTDRLVKAMSLTRVEDSQIGAREFRDCMPKEWNIVYLATAEYYVSSAWLTGDEGDMYVLRFDPADEFMYLYYYYNF